MNEAKAYYWLLVFEALEPVTVNGADIPQIVTKKWARSGEVEINPGQPTGDVIKQVATACKEDPEIPGDALVTNVVLFPAVLVRSQYEDC